MVGFAVFLAAIIVLGRAIGERFGDTGAIIGAVVVGLADVDSITVSITRLTPELLSTESATVAILAAVASNTVTKIVIGAAVGRGRFALLIAAMALACLLVPLRLRQLLRCYGPEHQVFSMRHRGCC